eukprot:3781311-Amphidinium_carterae.1
MEMPVWSASHMLVTRSLCVQNHQGSSVVANLEEGCLVRVTEVTGHTRGEGDPHAISLQETIA